MATKTSDMTTTVNAAITKHGSAKAALDAIIAAKMAEPRHFENAHRIIRAAKNAGHVG